MISEKIKSLPTEVMRYLYEFLSLPYLLDEIRKHKRKEKLLLYVGLDGINGYALPFQSYYFISYYHENDIVAWKYQSLVKLKELTNKNGISLPKYSRRRRYIQKLMEL